MEAIILAGGRGTRLQSVVSDVPKPMADISGKPFLAYQLDLLIRNGITHIVLAVGFKADSIIDYFQNEYKSIFIEYAIETQPLGTGGAIRPALAKCRTESVFVVNGDTYLDIDFNKIIYFHNQVSSDFTIATTQIDSSGRYGGVLIEDNNLITGFMPKEKTGLCFINAGVYLINKAKFINETESGSFSLENDYLINKINSKSLWGVPYSNSYFIDIGIPEDYFKACSEIPHRHSSKISKKYLFLDRDGVINKKINNDYVRSWGQFIFEDGALEAMRLLSPFFERICIVTNQRGVAKGLMTLLDVYNVHRIMNSVIKKNHGRIDALFVCPHNYDDYCNCRKPKTGLFYQAVDKFNELKFDQSIMVGDSISDIQAAYDLGITSVLINSSKQSINFELMFKTNLVFDNLLEWALHSCNRKGDVL